MCVVAASWQPDGTLVGPRPDVAVNALTSLYRAMVLTRTFDLKAVSLQRTGRLGTYAVSLGQEAVSVGRGQRHAARRTSFFPPTVTTACCSGAA